MAYPESRSVPQPFDPTQGEDPASGRNKKKKTRHKGIADYLKMFAESFKNVKPLDNTIEKERRMAQLKQASKPKAPKQPDKTPAWLQTKVDDWIALEKEKHIPSDKYRKKQSKEEFEDLEKKYYSLPKLKSAEDVGKESPDQQKRSKDKNAYIRRQMEILETQMDSLNKIINPTVADEVDPNVILSRADQVRNELEKAIAEGDNNKIDSLVTLYKSLTVNEADQTNADNGQLQDPPVVPSERSVKRKKDMDKRSERKKRQENITKWSKAGEVQPIMNQKEIYIYLKGGPPPQRFINRYGSG